MSSSSTRIIDLPDSDIEEEKKLEQIVDVPSSRLSFVDILVVLLLLLAATNNEVSKSILRFPLLKLQKTDVLFGILISVIFTAIYAIYKLS